MSSNNSGSPVPKRGKTIELTIEKFADKGMALARVDGFVVLVREGVPGDRVNARIYKKKKNYAEAEIEDVLEPSDLRTEPRCYYFSTCGGCRWQHVSYDAQLQAKKESVEGALIHQGGFDLEQVEVRPTIGAPDIYFYRNKMEFSFSAQRWLTPEEIATGKDFDTDFALGLHVPGNPFKVLDLHECHLQSEVSQRLVNGVRDFAKKHEWAPWHIRKHEGFLRHLVIRQAANTGDLMVNLVTNGYDEERMELLSGFLQREFPEVTTLVNTINTGVAQTAFGEAIHTIYGPGVIHDKIGSYRFQIASNAFFQTNTRQAERLYEVAKSFGNFQPDDLVYDLYCGAGTISIYIADAVKRVVGVELVEEAVANAKTNAELNGVDNCSFVSGDMKELFTADFVEQHGRPDVLLVDPPRGGMHPDVVKQIRALRPPRFVYVSCNPQTQARDLSMLSGAYTIEDVQPVDLFPHTQHIENVVSLTAQQ